MNIYTPLSQNSDKWLDNDKLAKKLTEGLNGFSSGKQAIRTRKKTYKNKICEILGFDIPDSYKREKPMFPIMNFDVYIQQSDNLQIWNDEISFERRYVIIKVNEEGGFIALKVISGEELATYDKTGTLTTKLQAILDIDNIKNLLYCNEDTTNLLPHLSNDVDLTTESPSANPRSGNILPIQTIYNRLLNLINLQYENPNSERISGDIVHKKCCKLLGYSSYSDNGQFPDIKNQLLEIKLQTSQTIDIGRENPTDTTNKRSYFSIDASNSDVRYAIIYAESLNDYIKVKNIIVTNGDNFFNTFTQMRGKIKNSKLQLHLPNNFFSN